MKPLLLIKIVTYSTQQAYEVFYVPKINISKRGDWLVGDTNLSKGFTKIIESEVFHAFASQTI